MTIDVHESEIVAILGSSGSGKSLLAHSILGILPYNSHVTGEIKYNGKAIESGTEIPEGSTLTIVAGNGNAVEDIEAADSVTIIESLFFNE